VSRSNANIIIKKNESTKSPIEEYQMELSEKEKISAFLKFKNLMFGKLSGSSILSEQMEVEIEPSKKSQFDHPSESENTSEQTGSSNQLSSNVTNISPDNIENISSQNIANEAMVNTVRKTLDKVLRVNMDKSKTDRPEWIILRYDSVFNPNSCYHMEIDWMISTGCIVDDFLKSVIFRKAKMCGVSLVQVPTDQIPNPFHVPIHIPILPIELWQSLQPTALQQILTSKFGFIFDSLVGFVHKSGCCFLSMNETGFQWRINSSMRSLAPMAMSLLQEFKIFCADSLFSLVGQSLTSTTPDISRNPQTQTEKKEHTIDNTDSNITLYSEAKEALKSPSKTEIEEGTLDHQ